MKMTQYHLRVLLKDMDKKYSLEVSDSDGGEHPEPEPTEKDDSLEYSVDMELPKLTPKIEKEDQDPTPHMTPPKELAPIMPPADSEYMLRHLASLVEGLSLSMNGLKDLVTEEFVYLRADHDYQATELIKIHGHLLHVETNLSLLQSVMKPSSVVPITVVPSTAASNLPST